MYGNNDTIEQKSGSTSHACFVSSLSVSPRKVSDINISEKQSKIGTTSSKTVQDRLVCLGCGTCQNFGGTGNRLPYPDSDLRASSVNDEQVQLILNRTCTLVEGHYQIGSLWASNNPKLPDNFAMAKARLNSLGKRLQSNPEVKKNYRQKVHTMLKEGHVTEVSDPSDSAVLGKTFYIPHHNIASKKFRVVMDCAAPFQ